MHWIPVCAVKGLCNEVLRTFEIICYVRSRTVTLIIKHDMPAFNKIKPLCSINSRKSSSNKLLRSMRTLCRAECETAQGSPTSSAAKHRNYTQTKVAYCRMSLSPLLPSKCLIFLHDIDHCCLRWHSRPFGPIDNIEGAISHESSVMIAPSCRHELRQISRRHTRPFVTICSIRDSHSWSCAAGPLLTPARPSSAR